MKIVPRSDQGMIFVQGKNFREVSGIFQRFTALTVEEQRKIAGEVACNSLSVEIAGKRYYKFYITDNIVSWKRILIQKLRDFSVRFVDCDGVHLLNEDGVTLGGIEEFELLSEQRRT